MATPKEQLIQLLREHPDARVVTDVGRSMIGGWGDLQKVIYHENNIIELEFD